MLYSSFSITFPYICVESRNVCHDTINRTILCANTLYNCYKYIHYFCSITTMPPRIIIYYKTMRCSIPSIAFVCCCCVVCTFSLLWCVLPKSLKQKNGFLFTYTILFLHFLSGLIFPFSSSFSAEKKYNKMRKLTSSSIHSFCFTCP